MELSVNNALRIALGVIAALLVAIPLWYVISAIVAVIAWFEAVLLAALAVVGIGYYASTRGYDAAVAGSAKVMGWFKRSDQAQA